MMAEPDAAIEAFGVSGKHPPAAQEVHDEIIACSHLSGIRCSG